MLKVNLTALVVIKIALQILMKNIAHLLKLNLNINNSVPFSINDWSPVSRLQNNLYLKKVILTHVKRDLNVFVLGECGSVDYD